ncbi:MAG: glycosyl transferase family 2 [Planctomycetaceae bacterium]|nr:glycosyl transferase family 2 [Planctomycetaceae bacterium]
MSPRILTALPVYNEAAHVPGVLAAVRRYSPEILVINDGSSDGTAEALSKEADIHVVTHSQNQGYGAALRSAFNYALNDDYDVLVTIDCDGQHQPELIPELAAALFADGEEWDIISGSRYLKHFDGDSLPPADRRRINMDITNALNKRLGLHLTDGFCGFKAYRVPVLSMLNVTELGYAMPLQVWVQAAANGLRIKEFPVPLIYLDETRSFGGSLDDSKRRLEHYRSVINRELAAVHFPALETDDCAAGCR